MASNNYINLHKDEETIRLTILTNICRMIVTRKHMDINKYRSNKSNDSNTQKNIVDQVSDNDEIDNRLFLPYIYKRVDSGIYNIPLDILYKDEQFQKIDKNTQSGETFEFDGSMVVVKIIPQKITDIGNSPLLNDFLKSHAKYHKIIVFDEMSDKAYNAINRKSNLEAFEKSDMMIDIMSYYCSPVSCEIVDEDKLKHITNPKISKIHENDPLARYYNAKKGNILRIIRPSLNNGKESAYRKVIEAKPIFK